MSGKAYIAGVVLLAIYLAVAAAVAGGLHCYAEDPRVGEETWDDDVLGCFARPAVSSRLDDHRSLSPASLMPEPRNHSRLFLLGHSLRC